MKHMLIYLLIIAVMLCACAQSPQPVETTVPTTVPTVPTTEPTVPVTEAPTAPPVTEPSTVL